MQRVTHLSGTLWFGLKSRCWLFGLQDTSRPVKPHLIGLCRLLTILVQAMFTSQGSFLSAKGWCWHSCFCLAVCNLWHSHPDLLFWWPGTWRNGCPSLSTAAGMLGKYSGSPKLSSLFNFVLHGEGGDVQPVLQDIPTLLSGDTCRLFPPGQDQDRIIWMTLLIW